MKRTDMVRKGAQQLIQTEDAIDLAHIEATTLARELSQMRMQSKLSMVVGDDAMGDIVQAIHALSGARTAMVRAHGHLNTVKLQLGCATVAVGTLHDKPETPGFQMVDIANDAA